LKKINKIIIIIQRSNGDVLFSSSLVKALYDYYNSPVIDLLVNDDTLSVASQIPHIRNIHKFSYKKKTNNRWSQEKNIICRIFKKYDLSINLTASDRSVVYALLSSQNSISAVESQSRKSWWKKLLLNQYYYFNPSRHILLNNLEPLNLLKINFKNLHYETLASNKASKNILEKLKKLKINDFVIFHPSAQYSYKIYPQKLRDILLLHLNTLGLPILVTGGSSHLDLSIKKQLPSLTNVIDLIGETSMDELFALSKLSLAYIGMDTLNMHIAASQNKPIFAIFGPTNVKMWSPWSNILMRSTMEDKPIQAYGDITIFQANMPCVACGKAGCDDRHGNSDCLDNINPNKVFEKIQEWHLKLKNNIQLKNEK